MPKEKEKSSRGKKSGHWPDKSTGNYVACTLYATRSLQQSCSVRLSVCCVIASSHIFRSAPKCLMLIRFLRTVWLSTSSFTDTALLSRHLNFFGNFSFFIVGASLHHHQVCSYLKSALLQYRCRHLCASMLNCTMPLITWLVGWFAVRRFLFSILVSRPVISPPFQHSTDCHHLFVSHTYSKAGTAMDLLLKPKMASFS